VIAPFLRAIAHYGCRLFVSTEKQHFLSHPTYCLLLRSFLLCSVPSVHRCLGSPLFRLKNDFYFHVSRRRSIFQVHSALIFSWCPSLLLEVTPPKSRGRFWPALPPLRLDSRCGFDVDSVSLSAMSRNPCVIIQMRFLTLTAYPAPFSRQHSVHLLLYPVGRDRVQCHFLLIREPHSPLNVPDPSIRCRRTCISLNVGFLESMKCVGFREVFPCVFS